MTLDNFPAWAKAHWAEVKEQLWQGRYRPQPVRRVEIPKPDGGVRLLGVPTVLDRLIQQAIAQVLAPLFDGNFSAHSYGFRPHRSTHQAVRQIQADIRSGRKIAVDIDLSKFFDRVNHDLLMTRLGRKVRDKRLLRLIKRYLCAGVMDGEAFYATHEGVPQGGAIVPPIGQDPSGLAGPGTGAARASVCPLCRRHHHCAGKPARR